MLKCYQNFFKTRTIQKENSINNIEICLKYSKKSLKKYAMLKECKIVNKIWEIHGI